MEDSTYTRTTTKAVLASLLTLFCFSGSAADLSSGSTKETKESMHTSENREVMKTSNKKLEERIKKICNNNPRKKADKAKEEQDKIEAEKNKKAEIMKKEQEIKLAAEKKKKEEMRLAAEKAKAKNSKSKDSKLETKDVKTKDIKAKDLKDATNKNKDLQTVTNKNIEDKSKAKAIETKKSGNTDLSLQAKSGLRITFGGVVDAQGYAEGSNLKNEDYNRHNTMPGKFGGNSYYTSSTDKIKGANPIFPQGIGNIGDYSDRFGMVADAILHLRAENKNEDLGILYGADVQFHVPVTEGKGASQGVSAARGRGAHLFVNSEYGDVKFGYQFGPEALMRLDATRIATVDGAADSDWFRKVNLEGSAASFPFYVTPRLWTESFSSESEKLSFRMAGKYNKGVMTTLPFRVAYYSPNYMGARFGVSYAPRYDSSLFSVSDNIAASSSTTNPYTAKIDEITDKFLEAGKITVPADKNDSAIKTLITTRANLNVDNIPNAKRDDALLEVARGLNTELAEKDANAVVNAGNTTFNGYKTTYDVEDKAITDAATASIMTKPTAYNDATKLAAEIEKKLATKSGADLPVSEVTKAVNAVLADIKALPNDKAATAKNAVEKDFRDKVVIKMLYDGTGGPTSAANMLRHVGPDYEHIISAGVSYEYDFEEQKIKVKASAVGEYGKAKQPNADKHAYSEYVDYNDLMGANFGVSADYKIDEDQSAKFAASFAYLGKSGQPKGIKKLSTDRTKYEALDNSDPRVVGIKAQFEKTDQDSKDTMYWTAGAGYQYQDIYGSLTYFGSKMSDGDTLNDVALGVQYDLSPACSKSKFIPYAAAHYFWTKEEGAITLTDGGKQEPNKGFLIITGVKFSF
jgi:actin-related protein